MLDLAAFVVDASVIVRVLVGGPFEDACQAFLDRCVARDARLLAPTCLYSEAANALYRLCLAKPPAPVLQVSEATGLHYSRRGVSWERRLPAGPVRPRASVSGDHVRGGTMPAGSRRSQGVCSRPASRP